jgi:hypothetical protein
VRRGPQAVADQIGAVELEPLQQVDHRAGEEGGVVSRPDRLVRVAKSRKVNGDDAKAASQRRGREPKRPLGA